MSSPQLRLLLAVVIVAFALSACGSAKSSSSASSSNPSSSGQASSTSESSTSSEAPGASSQASAGAEAPNATAGEVIAKVASTPITRAQVNHWMHTLAASDYLTVSRIAARNTTTPEALVSDPPNFPRCVEALEAAIAKSPSGHSRETGGQLLNKCRQLYEALRTQATTYLIGVQRTILLGRAAGVSPSDAEVQKLFDQFKARQFHTEAAFQNYLATNKRSVPDILVEMRIDLIGNALLKLLKTQQGHAHYNEVEARLTQRTDCKPGYVVEHCSQYTGGGTYTSSPPASVMMEQVAALSSGRCVNTEACGRQAGG